MKTATKTGVECPCCGTKRNQLHRSWCPEPPRMLIDEPGAKPGDEWGPYRLETDGWWRLKTPNDPGEPQPATGSALAVGGHGVWSETEVEIIGLSKSTPMLRPRALVKVLRTGRQFNIPQEWIEPNDQAEPRRD